MLDGENLNEREGHEEMEEVKLRLSILEIVACIL